MECFQEALQQGEVSLVQLDTALAEQTTRTCPEKQHSLQLDNLELWKEFHQHTNEMIITKAGRRMFPLIQLSLEDLDPLATYHLLLALRVKDSCRWRFLNGEWTGSEPVIRGVTCEAGPTDGCVYTLPPASGEGWMKQSPVGFSKLKLSNKDNDGGKVKLSSLHRYQPVAYLVKVCPQQGHTQTEASCTDATPSLEIYEHKLPETQFIAVTAYQNDLITQMKIKHNPFAKAFLPNPDKPSSSAGPSSSTEASPVKAQGAPLPVEAEAVPPPPSSWYMHQAPHFPPYYYSDGHYPPSYPDYYDTFSPVPAPPYQS